MSQTQIQFDISKAAERRDLGIMRAEAKANSDSREWSDEAYDFLVGYIKINRRFQVEDIRFASQGLVPTPENQRAWGGVVVRAAKAGLIRQDGFQKVKNIKAHRTPAAVWKTI